MPQAVRHGEFDETTLAQRLVERRVIGREVAHDDRAGARPVGMVADTLTQEVQCGEPVASAIQVEVVALCQQRAHREGSRGEVVGIVDAPRLDAARHRGRSESRSSFHNAAVKNVARTGVPPESRTMK